MARPYQPQLDVGVRGAAPAVRTGAQRAGLVLLVGAVLALPV